MTTQPAQVKAIFDQAVELELPEQRAAFLKEACGGNAELRARVERLLDALGAAGSFLESPPPGLGPGPDNIAATIDSEPAGAVSAAMGEHTPNAFDSQDANVPHTLTTDYRRDAVAGVVIGGRYTLQEKIGEGGMGEVWVAKQTEPVKRKVALKLIKTGMDSRAVLQRFEQERQALALMDHPHIARVLDGGMTPTGLPFFAMELVNGLPLNRFCDEVKLTLKARLELFVPICQAVQHAHQKGIVHRDLKPANILVTIVDGRPVPKVIDFGVAKATAGKLTEETMSTGFGAVVGTLEYMSPEQASFSGEDIDTRADIYSLGVILYELLTGLRPIDAKRLRKAALTEMIRIIQEEEPSKPSTRLSTDESLPSLAAVRQIEPRKLTALLRGELDWVVMRCLEKQRDRRYETANALARDIQRYLADEAVEARPPSTGYRLKKFVKRNKGQVVAASFVFLALVAGIVGTSLGLYQANQARDAEARQREIAEANEREANVQRAKAEDEKKKAIAFRDKALDALRATTGTDVEKLLGAKQELSANEKAYLEAIVKRWQTFARQEGTDEQSRAIAAEGHFRVALLWQKLGRRDEARPEYERSIAIREKLAAEFPAVPDYRFKLAQGYSNLGDLLADLGKGAEAEEQHRQALAIREKLVADFPAVPDYRSDLATNHNNLGVLLKELGKGAEAEEQYREALAIREKLAADFPFVPDNHFGLAMSQTNLGVLLKDLGKGAEAEERVRKGLAIREKLAAAFPDVPDYRSHLASSHNNMGRILGLEKEAEAEEQIRKGLALQENLAAEFPAVPDYRRHLALSHTNLGALLKSLGKRAEAEEQYRKGLAIREKLAADFPAVPVHRHDLAASHNNLGGLLAGLGKQAEAEEQYRKGMALNQNLAAEFPAVPGYRSALAGSHTSLGNLLAGLGKAAEAEEQVRKGLAVEEKLAAEFPAVPEYRSALAGSHNNLGALLSDLGKRAEAEEQFRKGMALQEKLAAEFPAVPDYRSALARNYNNLAALLAGLGKRAEAEEQYRKGLTLWEKLAADFPAVPDYRFGLAASHTNLGFLLSNLGKRPEAEEQYRKALAHQEKLAAEFPAVPDYRSILATGHNNLGILLMDLGKLAEAEEQYRKGLAIREKLAAEFPAVPDYQAELGGIYCNMGNLVAKVGKPAERLVWLNKAIETLRPVYEADRRAMTAKQFLRNSHESRAMAYHEQGKHAEAAKDWDQAVELSPKEEQPARLANLARSHGNQGLLLRDLGKRAEAEEQYRKGLAIREKLIAEFPAVPDYRRDLVTSHINLGLLLAGLGQRAEAEEQYRKGLTICEKLVADFPAVPGYRIDLGGGYLNFGSLVRDGGKSADSLAWYDKAIKTVRPVHEAEPQAVTAKQCLRISHLSRAMAYDELGKHAEANKDWDQAVELSPPQEQPGIRANRATSRLLAGMVAEAVAEVGELLRLNEWPPEQWYNFACVYAVASGKIAEEKQNYADRATELLTKSVKAGFKDAAQMKKDTDLDPLRDREDFKKLLAELENKFPPMKELIPPPKEGEK